jgi:HD-GYP domain-containing protein (c-di-GMP phosphodiesterase class II)
MLTSIDDVAQALASDERFASWEVRSRGDGYLELARGGTILVLAWPELWRQADAFEPHLTRARTGNYSLILLGTDDDFVDGHVDSICDVPDLTLVNVPVPAPRLVVALSTRGDTTRLRAEKAHIELELERAHHENELLIDIGRALSQQRDIESLLALILRRAREVTGADAGSVYIVEGDDDDVSKRTLRFKISQNDSVRMESSGFTLPVSSSSIVGTCVLSADVINIPDLYRLDEPGRGNNPWGFVHDRSFDDKHGYQTRSMLTVPMISAREQVIGVIQLINKRARGFLHLTEPSDFEQGVVPFDGVSVNYAATLASQAGIALENALLYDEVKTLFEGFVRASVTAIESRDPTTSGHSERVADLTVGLAKIADRADRGSYANLSFTPDEIKQIEWAGLLHDFGKVGVREHVLVKAKKLYPHERELILQRFQFIRRTLEYEKYQKRATYLIEASRDEVAEKLAEIDSDVEKRLAQLDDFIQFVLKANEPTVLAQGGFERLAEISALTYVDLEGNERPYLTADEVAALQVLKGSLTPEERSEIESHVVHTYNFLKQIPWGRVYRSIPEIAGAHHEKLNGKGYPNNLAAPAIPVEAKMMTISDIYDALTARDRPYKKALPVQKALDILGYEVKDGHLDKELYEMFLEAKVYEITSDR